jgi:SAM-dependent methyltransferase
MGDPRQRLAMSPGARIRTVRAGNIQNMSHEFRTNLAFLPLSLPPMNDVSASDWLATRPGRTLLEFEQRVLAEALSDVVGFEMLQVGRWGEGAKLASSARAQHHWLVAPDAQGAGSIRAHPHALPVASGSIEGVLLPHTLEHAPNPHEILREVERVLMGEGQVAICGFNPLGPWGLRNHLSRGRFLPHAVRLLGEGRIRDWLRLLGFEVVLSQRFLFVVPWRRRGGADAGSWFERRGPELFAPFAGAYLVKARKRVRALTPIRPVWQRSRVVTVGAAEPSTRSVA